MIIIHSLFYKIIIFHKIDEGREPRKRSVMNQIGAFWQGLFVQYINYANIEPKNANDFMIQIRHFIRPFMERTCQ